MNDSSLWSLRISDNKRFLAHGDGSPFFFLADTSWQLFHNLSFEDADFYLRARAAQGFTVVQAVALAEYGGLSKPNGEDGINWPQKKWKDALDLPDAWQMQHAKNLLLSRLFFERVPDSTLVLSGKEVAATREESGSYALFYIPDGAPIEVNASLLCGEQLRA